MNLSFITSRPGVMRDTPVGYHHVKSMVSVNPCREIKLRQRVADGQTNGQTNLSKTRIHAMGKNHV